MDRQRQTCGHILLSTQVLIEPIWNKNPHTFKLFLYLLLNARRKRYSARKGPWLIQEGELVTSLDEIAENNEFVRNQEIRQWHKWQVQKMLDILEKSNYIAVQQQNQSTHIRIICWQHYRNPAMYIGANRGWQGPGGAYRDENDEDLEHPEYERSGNPEHKKEKESPCDDWDEDGFDEFAVERMA